MKRIIFVIVFWVTMCSNQKLEKATQTISGVSLNPVVIGFAFDISSSVKQWPPVDSSLVRQLVDFVGSRNGVLAFGYIKLDSYSELMRFNLNVDTLQVSGTLSERVRQISINKQQGNQYLKESSRAFEKIMHSLNIKKNSQGSDLIGCLHRFSLLYQEAQFVSWDKTLIIISDGHYKILPKETEIPPVEILTVGMVEQRATDAFGSDVKMFESFSGVIAYLNSSIIKETLNQSEED